MIVQSECMQAGCGWVRRDLGGACARAFGLWGLTFARDGLRGRCCVMGLTAGKRWAHGLALMGKEGAGRRFVSRSDLSWVSVVECWLQGKSWLD